MPQTITPELAASVRGMKKKASLLAEVDRHAIKNLPTLAIGEVLEVAEALDQPDHPLYWNEVNGEVMDIFVFYLSMMIASGRETELAHIPGYINGIANKSNNLDLLSMALGDLRTENADSSAQKSTRDEIMRILISMVNHYPGLGNSAVQVMDRTVEKVLSNRDPRFYSAVEHGVSLTPDEISVKYAFLERFQRIMRDTLGRTLKSSDWDKVADLAYQWRRGQVMLDELIVRLQTNVLS